jgi:hypothetical protein
MKPVSAEAIQKKLTGKRILVVFSEDLSADESANDPPGGGTALPAGDRTGRLAAASPVVQPADADGGGGALHRRGYHANWLPAENVFLIESDSDHWRRGKW